jgi:hypothetical protein
MGRIIAAALAAMLGANGLVMLFAGRWWYNAVPGVTATGPYNPHFVRDIGAAYLVTAAGLGWFAIRPREAWPALVGAAAFQTAHVAIHVFDAFNGTMPMAHIIRDFAGVYLPTLLTVAIAVRRPTA